MVWTLVNLRWTLARATLPVLLLPKAVRSPLGLSVTPVSDAAVEPYPCHLFWDDVRWQACSLTLSNNMTRL